MARHNQLLFVTKFALSLLVIAGLGDLMRRGFFLFTQHTDPVIGTIIFVLELGVWIWLIYVLRRRRYKYASPKFKLIFVSILVILLICTFAGVQPLSSYKDNALARFKEMPSNNERQGPSMPSTENKEALEETDNQTDKDIKEFLTPVTLEVTDIRKAIHTGLAKPPGIKIDVYVELIKVLGSGSGVFYITLETEKENFGTKEIYWRESLQGMGICWDIGADSLAFIDLQTNKPCSEIFRVEVSSEPTSYEQIPVLVEKEITPEENEEATEEINEGDKLIELERDVLLLANLIRADRGAPLLLWDDGLYKYSKKQSEIMADAGDLIHSDINKPYGENCWGGSGSNWIADDIVESWVTSPEHRTWMLNPHLQHIAVGITISESGDMYAAWTFWRKETKDSDWWYCDNVDPPDWWH